MNKNPIIIIGAGIVGLSVARELRRKRPECEVLVLEKEEQIAQHQTGHNSGVIHSGIYYKPGTFKEEFCRTSGPRLIDYCELHQIPTKRVGKLIVATRAEEQRGLNQLFDWGKRKGLEGVQKLKRSEFQRLEPEVEGVEAVWLPRVSLVDFKQVAAKIREEFESAGGQIALHREVETVRKFEREMVVETDKTAYRASFLINCAGLYADKIATMCGAELDAQIVPFRGEYYELSASWAKKVRRLIYPVPNPKLPFLGIHLTPTLDERMTAGPNAVLAFARQGYARTDFMWKEVKDYLRFKGFWRMSGRFWKTGISEMMQSWSKVLYLKKIQRYLPGLEPKNLVNGFSGVRAQAVSSKGELVHDFMYVEQPRCLHILNAPSPAATSAFAIAERIVSLVPS